MSISTKAGEIKVTPLYGGDESIASNGVCTLLEIGSAKILLDCGSTSPPRYDVLERTRDYLLSIGGVDAIILSHADIHHVGGLHVIAGRKGIKAKVFCTYPVYNFSQLVLYDHILNLRMEGEKMSEEEEEVYEDVEEEIEDEESEEKDDDRMASDPETPPIRKTRIVQKLVKRKKPVLDYSNLYDFDDIDQAFSLNTLLKFNQSIEIFNKKKNPIFLSSIPSGRTLGGAIWKIRNGPAEIIYAMDINLKKEMLLDGLDLNLFSSISPTLLITDCSGMNQMVSYDSVGASASQTTGLTTSTSSKRTEKSDFLNEILSSLRQNNTILIPTETSSRTLELLLMLNKCWQENKLTQYPIFFLSHMSINVIELCQCNLEWMSNGLIKNFYNGKLNPFDMNYIKVIKNIKNLEKNFPGAKVILSSDSSLSYGFSKELLLKYGGDPKFKVIFYDFSDENSLAHELRVMEKTKPIITTISSPLRVELAGDELAEYNRKELIKKKNLELEIQKKKRQEELSLLKINELSSLATENGENNKKKKKSKSLKEGEEPDADDQDTDGKDIDDNNEESDGNTGDESESESEGENSQAKKKIKISKNTLEFFNQDFYFFDTKVNEFKVSDFGLSNNDLVFQNINSAENKFLVKDTIKKNEVNPLVSSTTSANTESDPSIANNSNFNIEKSKPWKLISTFQKFQLTCKFKSFNLSGRNDIKNIKALINKISPQKVLLLRNTKANLAPLVNYIKTSYNNSIEILNSSNFNTNLFFVNKEKIIVQIARNFIPQNTKKIFVSNSINSSSSNASNASTSAVSSSCTVSVLQGSISMQELMGDEGTKLLKFLGDVPIQEEENDDDEVETELKDDKKDDILDKKIREDIDNYIKKQEEKEQYISSIPTFLPPISSDHKSLVSSDQLGVAVSNGEVTLNNLKSYLESQNIKTDYQISHSGGVLILNDQVIIRKDNNNFSIEGPPIPAFYIARKALYNHCAFV